MNIEPKKINQNEWKTPQSIINYYKEYESKENILEHKIKNIKLNLPDKYKILDQVGRGSYGIVYAALNKETNENVAIKKIDKAFEHKIFARRTWRELRIMRLLNHENILSIIEIILPSSRESIKDIYVVYPLMETDLYSIIKTPQPLEMDLIKFIIYQMIKAIEYQNKFSIIHRDLKPRNILVSSSCDLKVCDFGLSRFIHKENNQRTNVLTDYIATRWYRAPELLIGQDNYDIAVDIWSVGCILVELINRKPLFTGTDWKNQLILILETLEDVKDQNLNFISNKDAIAYIKQYVVKSEDNLPQKIKTSDKDALDIIKKMLDFNPNNRIKIEEALNHPFLSKFMDKKNDIAKDESYTISEMHFEFENYELNREQLKDLIYEEILLYHFPEKLKKYNENIKKGKSTMQHILENSNKEFIDISESDEDDD